MSDLKRHPEVTDSRIFAAVERYQRSLDNPGFCLACGAEQDGCEPDAEGYECEACGEPQVYGAEELMFRFCDLEAYPNGKD